MTSQTQMHTIRRSVVVRAPRARVWRALTDINEFSEWFGVKADGRFAPGERVRMTSTLEECAGEVFYVNVEEMTPERRFSWSWHPGLMRPDVDYSNEPMTVVVFDLEDAEDGTLVTVTESGFDRISLARRAQVFEENDKGWQFQMVALERYAGRKP